MSRFIERLKKYVILSVQYLFRCFPIKKNKIFFFSYYGSQYGCNPKYITEYMLERTKETFDIVWAFNDPMQIGGIEGIRRVKMMSIAYFYELCTAKVIITNFRTTDLFRKRKSQYYIQTWHSSLRLKQIEKDAIASLPPHYVEMAKKDSEKCDLLLSGCQYSTTILKRSFWYAGEIFEQGTPRNDFLFKNDESKKERICSNLNISCDEHIFLYAPTFRKNDDISMYDLDYTSVSTALSKKFGGRWLGLVKLHPHIQSKSSQLVYGETVVDVTKYDDIQELLSIADVLITDYSSLMFDYVITKRPCFLYVPDVKDYIEQDRHLYFDLTELPFRIAKDNETLRKEIEFFQSSKYEEELDDFLRKIGSFETGHASERVVKHIQEVCFREKRRKWDEAV